MVLILSLSFDSEKELDKNARESEVAELHQMVNPRKTTQTCMVKRNQFVSTRDDDENGHARYNKFDREASTLWKSVKVSVVAITVSTPSTTKDKTNGGKEYPSANFFFRLVA